MAEPSQISGDELMLLRAQALDYYSDLEHTLCLLFAGLLGVDAVVAGRVFYRIANSRSRHVILESLLDYRSQNTYKQFWDSLQKLLRQLDTTRNQIVHWHHISVGDLGEETTFPPPPGAMLESRLAAPQSWYATGHLTSFDLEAFCEKCEYVTRAANVLMSVLNGTDNDYGEPAGLRQSVCQQPIPYPPPDTHPLSRNYKGPESQPLP